MSALDRLGAFCSEFRISSLDDERPVSIYFLIWRGEIVYVGQTVNLGQRVAIHRSNTRQRTPLRFDRVLFFEVAADDASAYEGALIRALNPRRCRRAPVDDSRDEEILGRLGISADPADRVAFLARQQAIWDRSARRGAASRRKDKALRKRRSLEMEVA